jgi:hypothetical protein
MKIFTKILALFIIVVAIGSASCRRSNNSKYFYDSKKDTSAPKINISVPLQNDNYNYGEDIHIVGTVTDLQTVGFGGKLQTLNIKVEELNDLDSVYIADLLVKTRAKPRVILYTFIYNNIFIKVLKLRTPYTNYI